MTFYERVKGLCDQRGISITSLVLALGFSGSAATTWKTSKNLPRASTIKKVADYFRITVEELKADIDCINRSNSTNVKFRIWKEIGLFNVGENPVILQELINDDYAKYCVQYAGSGHYFSQLDDVAQHLSKKWGKVSPDIGKLVKIIASAPILDIEPRLIDYRKYANDIHNSNVIQGNIHAPVTINNDTERTLSDQELEILCIFSELDTMKRAKVLVYAAELQDKKQGGC